MNRDVGMYHMLFLGVKTVVRMYTTKKIKHIVDNGTDGGCGNFKRFSHSR